MTRLLFTTFVCSYAFCLTLSDAIEIYLEICMNSRGHKATECKIIWICICAYSSYSCTHRVLVHVANEISLHIERYAEAKKRSKHNIHSHIRVLYARARARACVFVVVRSPLCIASYFWTFFSYFFISLVNAHFFNSRNSKIPLDITATIDINCT